MSAINFYKAVKSFLLCVAVILAIFLSPDALRGSWNYEIITNGSITIPTENYGHRILNSRYFYNEHDGFVENETPVKILFWMEHHGYYNLNYKSKANCAYKNCEVLQSKTQYREADVIWFHNSQLNWNDIPPSRTSNQYYVFYEVESPQNRKQTNLQSKMGRGFYNLTHTYRRDSDIPTPHVTFKRRHKPWTEDQYQYKIWYMNLTNIVEKKSKMAVQFNSHCHSTSQREKVTEYLQKIMPVDVYGHCGKLKCGGSGYMNHKNCEKRIKDDYKFYLSFENSICKGYVTEKFYRPLQQYAVPIVLQNSNYEAVFPTGSYIAVDKFNSIESLVDYLNYLDSNDTAYMEYFQFHASYTFSSIPNDHYCAVCTKYNNFVGQRKIYDDIQKWWDNDAQCVSKFGSNLIKNSSVALIKNNE